MREKLAPIAMVLSALLFALLLGAFWFQWIDGAYYNPPIVFHKSHEFEYPITPHTDEPISDPHGVTHHTLKGTYKLGETVQAKVSVQKNRDIPGILQWSLMDKRFYPYAPRRGVVPVGHHHLVVNVETIPAHIPIGQYYFSGQVEYRVNFFKTLVIPIRTNCFEVVE